MNKIDLIEDREAALEPLRVYQELHIPIAICSTRSGEGIDSLRKLIERKISAFVGHSGVGKSSILNALDGRLQLATAGVHKRGTGRHTTTELVGAGLRVTGIDLSARSIEAARREVPGARFLIADMAALAFPADSRCAAAHSASTGGQSRSRSLAPRQSR